ncbi:MAG: zinc-dependent metalloprotease [Actinobacteria bacterium]|nr:zinc-dependent metalloprotease [Actinomycetota bacterium]
MADDSPSGDDTPDPFKMFGSMGFLGDMMKAMGSQGPLNWDIATQFAGLGALGDSADSQPDPTVRFAYNDLARVADMHVRDVSGLDTNVGGRATEILTTTRSEWARRTLKDFRPLFTDLATSLSQRDVDTDTDGDPMAAMMASLSGLMAPAMVGMTVGGMVGALAQRAFGQYDFPLPRADTSELLLVPSTIENFATDWSLAIDDVRMWVLIHELTSHAVLNTAAVEDGITDLVRRHVSLFKPDSSAVMDALSGLDASSSDALEHIQKVFSDPTLILGAVRSSAQEELAPLLDAHVAAVLAYIDHIVDHASQRVLGSGHTIAEAVRRRRLEAGKDAVFVERLLGLHLTRQQLERGAEFIRGVIERGGEQAPAKLIQKVGNLPTPSELEAPGLWLARLEIQ